MDPRTRAWLDKTAEAIKAAEEICNCAHCTAEREKKEIIQCDKNAIAERLPSKIIRNPDNFVPDLSSNPRYWKITPTR